MTKPNPAPEAEEPVTIEVDLTKPGKAGKGIAELLGEMLGSKASTEKPMTRERAEAELARLQTEVQRFHEPNPFKVGDAVTVRENIGKKGHGWPMRVIETFNHVHRLFGADVAGGIREGTHVTTRVVFIHPKDGVDLSSWSFHHSELEPYLLPVPDVERKDEPEIEGAAV